ncbi:hypothetical protein BDR07DRAFT_1431781, partial [Suillus spraguei]
TLLSLCRLLAQYACDAFIHSLSSGCRLDSKALLTCLHLHFQDMLLCNTNDMAHQESATALSTQQPATLVCNWHYSDPVHNMGYI